MRGLLADPRARWGLGLLGLAVFIAFVVGAFFTDPGAPVSRPLQPPSAAHWLGTTGQGQDVLAQTLVGGRATLMVAFLVVFLTVSIGALVGTVAGYFGGWVDDVLSLIVNIFLVMPGLPLMVILAAYLPPGSGGVDYALLASYVPQSGTPTPVVLELDPAVAAGELAGIRSCLDKYGL